MAADLAALDVLLEALITCENVALMRADRALQPDLELRRPLIDPSVQTIDLVAELGDSFRPLYWGVDTTEVVETLAASLLSDEFYRVITGAEDGRHTVMSLPLGKDWDDPRNTSDEFVDPTISYANARMTALSVEAAARLGVPLFASRVEAPICMFQHLTRHRAVAPPLARAVMDIVRDIWSKAAADANLLRQFDIYPLDMPFFLLQVLRNSTRPEDIIPIALDIRRSPEAVALRQWSTALSVEGNPAKVVNQLREIRELARKFLVRAETTVSRTVIGLSFGGPSVETSVADIKEALFPRREMRLVKGLLRSASEVGGLTEELIRVFKLHRKRAEVAVYLLSNLGRGSVHGA